MIAYVVQYLIGIIVGPVVGALVAAWTGEHLISAIAGIFAGVIASSKAFLESYKVVQEIRLNERKLREADRIIVTPPPMISASTACGTLKLKVHCPVP